MLGWSFGGASVLGCASVARTADRALSAACSRRLVPGRMGREGRGR